MAARQEQAPQRTPTDGRDAPASHSGKLLVRMPATLHADLADAARREGVSLNALVVGALSGAVGWRSDRAAEPAARAEPGAVAEPAAQAAPPAAHSRTLSVALAVNLVVVLLAAAAAIGLVIAAWPS